jgi:CheY-like chemotaxis protein
MPGEEPPDTRHILVVEDNDDDVKVVKPVLSETGLPVHLHVAKDGRDALDFGFRRAEHGDAPQPDLALLDLRVPAIDGLDVLRRVKADPAYQASPSMC